MKDRAVSALSRAKQSYLAVLHRVPVEPRAREAELIGQAIAVGIFFAWALGSAAEGRFLRAAFWLAFAVFSAWRVTILSVFGYGFRRPRPQTGTDSGQGQT